MLICDKYFLSPAKIKRQGNQPIFSCVWKYVLQVSTRLNFLLFRSLLLELSPPRRPVFCHHCLPFLRVDDSFKILLAAQWIFNERSSCDTCSFCRALRLTLKGDRKMVLWACKSTDFHLREVYIKAVWGSLMDVTPQSIYYFPRSSTKEYFMSKVCIKTDPPVGTSVLWLIFWFHQQNRYYIFVGFFNLKIYLGLRLCVYLYISENCTVTNKYIVISIRN